MWTCRFCNKEFDFDTNEHGKKGGHAKHCLSNPNYEINKEKMKLSVEVSKKTREINKANGKVYGHNHTEEQRKHLSEKRKEYLRNNPDAHVWKRATKFKSGPCEYLKSYLKENNIEFEEEVSISHDRFFSIDILIPSKNLILEVNGNQHYNSDGSLSDYYKERHEYLLMKGFNVIEIHYSKVYNKEEIFSIIQNVKEQSIILPFRMKEKIMPKYGTKEKYLDARRVLAEEKEIEDIEKVRNSDIDFTKYGWSTQVALLINKGKISNYMKKYLPDIYEIAFKRKH